MGENLLKPKGARVLKDLMAAKGWTANMLAEETAIPLGTVQAYLQGGRRASPENVAKLAKALSGDQAGAANLEGRLRAAFADSGPRSWWERLDAPDARLRKLPFHYPPITDGKNYFIDELLQRLFTLCVIGEEADPKLDPGFDLKRRVDAVWRGDADMLTGLCSLPRLKLLHYYVTPIRISINAVIDRAFHKHVPFLRQALIGRLRYGLRAIAVRGEIGDVHVRQTAKIQDVAHVEDLKPQTLAERLREEASKSDPLRGRVPVVCCDEITAMGVVKELGSQGMLVFPPSTAESIQECAERKELPTHLAGFAVSRREAELILYLDAALNLLLETEVEVIAQAWARAYETLLKEASEWLSGQIETSDARVLTLKERKIAETRVARAYARRAFRMTIEGIDSCRQGHSSWLNILRRARQIEHEKAAANRTDIRNRVLDMLAGFFGTSMEWTAANVNSILSEARKDSAFEKDLRLTLMREFDIELSSELPSPASLNHLEGVVSMVQHALEIEAGWTQEIRVVAVSQVQAHTFRKLLRDFEEHVGVAADKRLSDERMAEHLKGQENSVLIATHMRHAQGFVMMTPEKEGKANRLERLYVEPSARRHGIGAHLVRRALEISADKNRQVVVMNPNRFRDAADEGDRNRNAVISLVEREGFVRSGESSSDYEYVISKAASESEGGRITQPGDADAL